MFFRCTAAALLVSAVSAATLVARQGDILSEVPEQCQSQCQEYIGIATPCAANAIETGLDVDLEQFFTCVCTPELSSALNSCFDCLIPIAEAGELPGASRELLEASALEWETLCNGADDGSSGEPSGGSDPSEDSSSSTTTPVPIVSADASGGSGGIIRPSESGGNNTPSPSPSPSNSTGGNGGNNALGNEGDSGALATGGSLYIVLGSVAAALGAFLF
ncbi:hypothetical protein FA15DRAFT_693240 [Coprinopsis marcescibilis]|uniref:Extracellular membrane protein CFEM domain-containing protein n=1 Tax=Coprinopsis marcescibilis TaxID=230819 RepID=A0A5C3L0U5_COPMA|nr:hypothetical protein FA15DRAFT_693240 [Coprinopsis marcescibilis]